MDNWHKGWGTEQSVEEKKMNTWFKGSQNMVPWTSMNISGTASFVFINDTTAERRRLLKCMETNYLHKCHSMSWQYPSVALFWMLMQFYNHCEFPLPTHTKYKHMKPPLQIIANLPTLCKLILVSLPAWLIIKTIDCPSDYIDPSSLCTNQCLPDYIDFVDNSLNKPHAHGSELFFLWVSFVVTRNCL